MNFLNSFFCTEGCMLIKFILCFFFNFSNIIALKNVLQCANLKLAKLNSGENLFSKGL